MKTKKKIKWSTKNSKIILSQIKLLPTRVQVLLGIEWSQSIQWAWQERYPGDLRPQHALEIANQYVTSGVQPDGDEFIVMSRAAHNARFESIDNALSYNAASSVNSIIYGISSNLYNIYCSIFNVATDCNYVNTSWSWLQLTYNWTAGPSYPFDPEWRTTTAVQLAKQILANKELECMPILSDALQDAGLSDTNWLTYLQSGRDEWVRSNWLIWNLLELDTEKPIK